MLNLKGPDAMVAEQFLCIICANMDIPKFTLGTDGVKKSSVLIPQCESCDSLACYSCWRDHVKKDSTSCPNCMAPIQKRTGSISVSHDKRNSRALQSPGKSKNYIREDPFEADFDRFTVFCRQKLLLNIIFEQKIHHEC